MKFLIYILWFIMPNELIRYDMLFKDRNDQDVYVYISDYKEVTDLSTATLTIKQLQPGTVPVSIEAFNTGGRLYGIFGKRCTVSFKKTGAIGMNTFSDGENGRFFMQVVTESQAFNGYVVMDDNRESYTPSSDDVYVTATDGLALLEDVPLTDFDGARIDPDVPLTRIKLLAYALYKTGLGSDIIIVDNLYEAQMLYRSTGADLVNNPWDQSYQFPLTYESEIDVMEDCKTVIEKLLGTNFRLCWAKGNGAGDGAFWVQRITELKRDAISYTRFNSGGASIFGAIDYEGHKITIGHKNLIADNPVYFINRETEVTNRRPSKSVQVEFDYDVPADIPRNKAFIRGTLNLPYSGVDFTAYDPADWTIGKDSVGTPAVVIIKKFFTDDYEVARYLEFSPLAVPDTTLTSKKVYMVVGDKFKFSIDRKLSSDMTGGGGYTDTIAKIRLYGTDGSFYTLHGGVSADPQIRWEPCTAAFNSNQKLISEQGNNNQNDFTEWHTNSVESAPLPVSGYILIQLYQSAIGGTTRYTRFSNLVFEYIPLINGSYKKYTGERVTITREGNYSNPIKNTEQFNTSASTKFLHKGSLLRYNSGTGLITLLSDRWFDWTHYHATAETVIDKRLSLVALDHFNQYRKTQKEFILKMKGITDANGAACDLINVYTNTVNSVHNNNKSFMLLDFNQNLKTLEWSGNALEIHDSTDDYADADDYDLLFKYKEK